MNQILLHKGYRIIKSSIPSVEITLPVLCKMTRGIAGSLCGECKITTRLFIIIDILLHYCSFQNVFLMVFGIFNPTYRMKMTVK